MKHQEFFWQTDDDIKIYAQEWKPEGETRAVVALVHGLGEHSGRYQHVAEFLGQSGFAVLSFDLRGHGQSGGVRGHAASYDAIMDDIRRLTQEAARRYPNKPCFLYGHSLGGNLVLYYTLSRRPAGLYGVISSSPGLATAAPVPDWKMFFGRLMYRLYPSAQMDNGLDRSGLSRDPQVIAAYNADPLVHGKISARLAMDLIDGGQWILQHASEFPLALLVMQGSADRLVDPHATVEFADQTPGDLTFRLWEGFYHELHNEPEKVKVLGYVTDWLNAHVPTGKD